VRFAFFVNPRAGAEDEPLAGFEFVVDEFGRRKAVNGG